MSNKTKKLLSFAIVAFMSCFMVMGAQAQIINIDNVASSGGLSNASAEGVLGKVINLILGLLGAIALIIILIGGFKWMTSGGSEDKIGEAKKLMGAGIVGLIIVLAAYVIAKFVMQSITSVVTDETTSFLNSLKTLV